MISVTRIKDETESVVDSEGPSAELEARLDTAPNGMVLHGPKSLLKREQPDGCFWPDAGSYLRFTWESRNCVFRG